MYRVILTLSLDLGLGLNSHAVQITRYARLKPHSLQNDFGESKERNDYYKA